MEYYVTSKNKQVGTVTVEAQGLYLEIRCQCKEMGDGFHRLHMIYQDKTIALGLLVLENNAFVLKKKIPKKSVGHGIPEFVIVSDEQEPSHILVRLVAGAPVQKLEMIRFWQLCIRSNETWVFVNSQNYGVLIDPKA